MKINADDIERFALDWFHTVHRGGTGPEQAEFFRHPNSFIVAADGSAFDMDAHHKLHQNFVNEKHEIKNIQIVPLSDSPERVRVSATVYWEAGYKKNPDKIIRSVAGEDWIIEKLNDGSLKFVMYYTTFFHLLPDSAELSLDFES